MLLFKMNINLDSIYQQQTKDLFESQKIALDALIKWWRSDELECTLTGSAGTGKTYLIKIFLQTFVDKSHIITAPTHKALQVLEKRLQVKGKTLQSLHGLKPDVDMENFDIDSLEFNTIGTPKMENYSLMAIDESSMINKSLFNLNRERSKAYNCKVLYIGDPLQLPPVNEHESEVFHSVKNVVKLSTIIRQGENNPLLNIFNLLRYDIENKDSKTLEYLGSHRNKIIKSSKGEEGYKVLGISDFKNDILQYYDNDNFFSNIDYVRTMAYTNLAVGSWNTFIRNSIFETKNNILILNDLLTSYKTLVDENNNPIIVNSDDYIIEDISSYKNEMKLKVNLVVLTSCSTNKNTETLQVLDHSDLKNVEHYINILSALRDNAKKVGGRKGWYPFYKFKNNIIAMIDVTVDGRIIKRELDYGYAMTVHKSQGSTFDNVFVDGQDICSPLTKYGKRYPNELNLRNRLLYVALSRTKNISVIKF